MNTHGGARKGSGRKRTPINTRRMHVLREQGKSYPQIAKAFDVRKNDIEIVAGLTSRDKRVEIQGDSETIKKTLKKLKGL